CRRRARRRPAIERAALGEERRLGRVEIFRLAVADDTAAEGDDATAAITDREHHAVAEIVERRAAVVRLMDEARFDQQRLWKLAGERAFQGLASIRCIAEPEAADGPVVEAAARQIFA